MKAVVLHEYGGPEKLKFEDNVAEPQISGSTVLIAAAVASVNPIEWKLRSGMRQKDSPLLQRHVLSNRNNSVGGFVIGGTLYSYVHQIVHTQKTISSSRSSSGATRTGITVPG